MSFERIPLAEHLDWMEVRQSDPEKYAGTGHFLTGWSDQIWILHAMWEHLEIPEAVTYAEVDQILSDLGERPPIITDPAELDRDACFAGDQSFGFDTGGEWGLSLPPPEPWKRLQWSDYMTRRGLTADPNFIPCSRWLGWDFTTNVTPPAEGSLDLAQLENLVAVLADHDIQRSRRRDTLVFAWCSFHSPIPHQPALNDEDEFNGQLFVGPLRELPQLATSLECAPNNIWPEDRDWFITTDADAWGTLVQGPSELIDRIRNNEIPLERLGERSPDRVLFDVNETFDSRLTPKAPPSSR